MVGALTGSVTSERFEIRRLLGWGGMGVVYEAIDRERHARVALKTLRRLDAAALLRFKHEFRSLVDLSHENLVRFGELIEEGGQLYFTMELVEGQTFVDYVQGVPWTRSDPPREMTQNREAAGRTPDPAKSDGGRAVVARDDSAPSEDLAAPESDVDLESVRVRRGRPARRPAPTHADAATEDRLRRVVAQLARGLNALHDAGRVHRDIKPSNVLVTREGRAVILDFGLVTEPSADEAMNVVGTVHFMAPEQAAGRAVGPAADWYSVGVMMYLALTGLLPFETSADVVAQVKQHETPLPPDEIVPGLSQDLVSLTMDLLRVDPTERPTGQDVLLRLRAEDASDAAVHHAALAGQFVGRQHELSELHAAFADARSGRIRALVVEGESGVGKSALVQRFAEEVEREALVFATRCYESERVRFKAVDALIDQLGQHLAKLPEEEVEAILPTDADVCATAFPVLTLVPPIARRAPNAARLNARPEEGGLVLDLLHGDPPASDAATAGDALQLKDSPPSSRRDVARVEPSEQRARMFGALRALFGRVASERPIVLAIDDLQWADADSLALIAELLRLPADRGGPLSSASASVARTRGPSSGIARVLLVATVRTGTDRGTPWNHRWTVPASVTRVLQLARLPADDARALVSVLLERIHGKADGGIDVEGIVAESRGHPLFLEALVRHRLEKGSEEGPVKLEEALWARVAALPARARMLLTLAAIAHTPLLEPVARHALSADTEELDALAATLRAAHLVRVVGVGPKEAVEVYHDRIAETVLGKLSAEDRKIWHAKLAGALTATGEGQAEALAVHWRGAGDAVRAAGYAVEAAAAAMTALAFDQAAGFYRMAIELSPNDARDRDEWNVRLGDALACAGRGREAAAAYLAAAQRQSDQAAIELRRRAADNLLRSGYVDEGMDQLRLVLAAAGLALPVSPSTTLTSLLFRRVELRLRGLGFQERALAQISVEDLRRVDVCFSAARGLAMVDNLRGAYFQTRALLFALRAGDPYRISRSLSVEVPFVAIEGASGRGRADELLAAAERTAAWSGHPHAIALVPNVRGAARFLEGRWREALHALVDGEALLRTRCVDVSWELSSTVTFILWCFWFLGDLGAFCARTPTTIQEAEGRGDRFLATNLRSSFTNAAWLVQDDPDTAEAQASGAIALWSRAGFHLQHFHDLVARTQIDLYRGDGAAAHRRMRAGWKGLEDSLSLRAQLVRVYCGYLRGIAAVVAAQGGAPGAEQAAARAARQLEREDAPWAAPLSAIVRGGVASLRGDAEGAARAFTHAEHAFTAADMAAFALAARRAAGLARGDAAGKAESRAAEHALGALGVVRPDRFATMLAPGAAAAPPR